MARVNYTDIQFYKRFLYFITGYKNELEDLSNFIDSKLGILDEKEEDVKSFLRVLEKLYDKFGPSEEVDNYYIDNVEKFELHRDIKLMNAFKKVIEIENNLKGQ